MLKMPLIVIILLATIICFSSYAFDPNVDFWITINGPNHILPNQQGINYTVTPHNPEGSCTYSWSGGGTGESFVYNAGASGQNTFTCTGTDSVNPPDSYTKTVKICNVTSLSPDKTAIMKSGSENITITVSLYCILPAGGQIEWQRKFNDGSTWTGISGPTQTERTLASSESVGKYKYRARVIGNTGDVGWKESGDLIVYDIRIKRGDDDITDDTTEVWVGEKISLTYEILPEDSGVTLENNHWYIPEIRIKNYTFNPSDDDSAQVTELSNSDLEGDNVDFYWVNGTIEGELKEVGFVNLDGVDIIQTVNFQVKKPELDSPFNNNYEEYPPAFGYQNNKFGLYKGNVQNPGQAGIQAQLKAIGADGQTQFGQLINNYNFKYWITMYPYYWEDDYNGPSILDHGLDPGSTRYFYDFPGIVFAWFNYTMGYVKQDFTLAFMYKPNTEEAIYIPCWVINWEWEATANKNVNNNEWNYYGYQKNFTIIENYIPEWNDVN